MSSKVKIAIIDSGINRKLAKKIKYKNEFTVDENNNCREDDSEPQTVDSLHGTICSLIIAKYCPGCEFSSIRILNRKGRGDIAKMEPALEWCIQNNIKIVNMSLGSTHFKDIEKLNKLINKYVQRGLIIVAAVSNIGYFTVPASFANIIGVAAAESTLLYVKDYVHLGIDAVVSSVHSIYLNKKEHITSFSNSYAAPYVSALVAQKILEDETCDLYTLKKYVRKKSHIPIVDGLDNPDWVYKAYIKNKKNCSKAEYYFETITGNYESIEEEIDTIIVYSRADLEQINIRNKNLIYLGNDDIENIQISGFKWSQYTRVQQIVNHKYQSNGLNIPLIIFDVKETMDKYFILSKIRECFKNDGYHAYMICMEPEGVLYGYEYIPDAYHSLTNQNVKNFIEGQVFYKQNDLILWNVAKEQKTNIYDMYPNYDIEILFDDTEALVYIEKSLFYKSQYNNLSDRCIMDIYSTVVNCLREEENE